MNQTAPIQNQPELRPPVTEPKPSMESIEELFAVMESPLLGYALRLVQDPSSAEDLVQEAFLRLHGQFESVQEPRRWLYRTLHNLALNHLRQSSKIVPFDAGTEPSDSPVKEWTDPSLLPDEALSRSEGIRLIRKTVETLDERSRDLLRLKFHEGLSYKEISVRTGLTVGHVGYLLHQAVKSVGIEISKSGVLP